MCVATVLNTHQSMYIPSSRRKPVRLAVRQAQIHLDEILVLRAQSLMQNVIVSNVGNVQFISYFWKKHEYMDLKKDIAEYLVAFVAEFAKHYGLTDVQAFRYLYDYKAIDLLNNQYGFVHTQSFESTISDVTIYCKRMGGTLG